MAGEVAAGKILASIPYYLIKFGYLGLKQDEYHLFAKISGIALGVTGVLMGAFILLSGI
jgi:hypothetical protein